MNKIINFFYLPPSLPIAIGTSPTGEGALIKPFPRGGNRKGGYLELNESN
jgi:hypothetical protein